MRASSALTSLRCSSQRSSSSSPGSWVARRALVEYDGHHRIDDRLVALVEHEQRVHARVGLEVPLPLDVVVQADDGGRRAPVQDPPARVEPVGERPEAEGGSALDRWHAVQPEAGAGDDAERAFAPDEQLGEVGAHRGARRAAGADVAAVGERDVEPDDHVLDLPVARRVLARAAARQPSADGRQLDRLRPVPDRHAVRPPQLVLEHVAEGARLHVEHERLVIDVDDARHTAEVEDQPTVHRHARAAHTAAARGRCHGDACVVAHAQDVGDLLGRRRPRDRSRKARHLAVERPDHRQRPPVTARLGERAGLDAHVAARHHASASAWRRRS